MTTIADFIQASRKSTLTKRIETLARLNAPDFMVDKDKDNLSKVIDGSWIKTVPGIKDFGDLEYTAFEVKKGNGGKQYVSFTTVKGIVNYFPNARFGPFLSQPKAK